MLSPVTGQYAPKCAVQDIHPAESFLSKAQHFAQERQGTLIGIPRAVTEHRLNFSCVPGASPVVNVL